MSKYVAVTGRINIHHVDSAITAWHDVPIIAVAFCVSIFVIFRLILQWFEHFYMSLLLH